MLTFGLIRPHKRLGTQGSIKAVHGIVAGAVVLVLMAIALVVWYVHRPATASNNKAALTQTYCSSTGKVCFSYPKGWQVKVDSQSQVTLTDQSTETTVQYSPQLISASDPCAAGTCLFKTLSAEISNGFSNANDIAGIFQNKGTNTFTPEYFLVATKQLLNAGLGSGGTTVDAKQTALDLGFVNGSLTQLNQSLEVVPPPSMSFTSLTAAQNWLSGPSAKTAIAVVNSARPKS